ncbi:hypothetical protein Tco_0710923 [Tanacetum coccineum]
MVPEVDPDYKQSQGSSLSWAVLVVRVGSLTINPSPPFAFLTISPLKGVLGLCDLPGKGFVGAIERDPEEDSERRSRKRIRREDPEEGDPEVDLEEIMMRLEMDDEAAVLRLTQALPPFVEMWEPLGSGLTTHGGNSQVATLGMEAVTGKTWAEMKVMMTEEFCPPEEIQRLDMIYGTYSRLKKNPSLSGRLEDVPLFVEFPDVFPRLARTPRPDKWSFVIELLHELSVKGFIRPSYHRGEDPVLFGKGRSDGLFTVDQQKLKQSRVGSAKMARLSYLKKNRLTNGGKKERKPFSCYGACIDAALRSALVFTDHKNPSIIWTRRTKHDLAAKLDRTLSDYDCGKSLSPGNKLTYLMQQILEAQVESLKEGNVKKENLGRMQKQIFEIRTNGIRLASSSEIPEWKWEKVTWISVLDSRSPAGF